MNLNALLVALLTVTVALAGCTKDTDGDVPPDEDPTKGSISGLLVDDNFRPIQLKEEWANEPGDYQDIGFILLVETAERLETTENGEFEVTGLDPGKYTLRVAAQNHEAIEKSVQVEANDETAATLEARRKSSASNPVLTIEFSGFVPCATGGGLAVTAGCTYDRSGDSYRPGPIQDYRAPYGTDAHYLVIEAVASQPGDYSLVFREDDVTGTGGFEFGRTDNADLNNPYFKIIFENSAVYGTLEEPPETYTGTSKNFYEPEHNPRFKGQNDGSMRCGDLQEEDGHDPADYCSWPSAFPDETEEYNPMEALVFYWGEGDAAEVPRQELPEDDMDETPSALCPNGCGVSAPAGRFAIKFNYVISIFIGEPTPSDDTPEDDLNEYCILCKGYLDETG